jgi:hypothetical protein
MIKATLPNIDAVTAWLASLGPKAEAATADAANELTQRLLDLADTKLSGEVLNTRSGALRASLRAAIDLTGSVLATITADTPYAAYQEYGFTGTESVRAHLRRQTQAFGRPITPTEARVRAYSRQVDFPAHSYLRAALAELAPDIQPALADAAARALTP